MVSVLLAYRSFVVAAISVSFLAIYDSLQIDGMLTLLLRPLTYVVFV